MGLKEVTEGAATHPWAETCHLVPPGSSWGVLQPYEQLSQRLFAWGWRGGGCVSGNLPRKKR